MDAHAKAKDSLVTPKPRDPISGHQRTLAVLKKRTAHGR